MAIKHKMDNMAKLECHETGEIVEHPVGEDGQKTLSEEVLREHFEKVGLLP